MGGAKAVNAFLSSTLLLQLFTLEHA